MYENLYYFDAEANGYYDEAGYYYDQVQYGLSMVAQSTKNADDFPINSSKLFGWLMKLFSALGDSLDDNWVDKMKKKYMMYFEGGKGNFGANQSSPLENCSDEEIIRLIRQYYPDMTVEEIEKFLITIESEGCSYAALTNTIFVHFHGRSEEFRDVFGFDMYTTDEVTGRKVYNFDYLMVDMYCSMDDKKSFLGLFEFETDIYSGTIPYDREYIITEYLESKGIEATYTHGEPIPIPTILSDLGVVRSTNSTTLAPTAENYDRLSERGQVLLVCPAGVTFKGIGQDATDETPEMWHVVTVLGYEPETESFIVSSWGAKYYVTQESIENPEGWSNKFMPSSFELIEYK